MPTSGDRTDRHPSTIGGHSIRSQFVMAIGYCRRQQAAYTR
ncbi:hypothetical protein ACQ4M4_15825 [Leptolyngbya sp. AN02str]